MKLSNNLRAGAVACTVIACMAVPAQAVSVEMEATNPVVELSVTETVESKPDIAVIGTGVTSLAMTASEALQSNSAQMEAVIKRLKSAGVAPKDIQTSGISISPQFNYRNSQEPVFTGYQVSNRVSVTVRDLDKLGQLIEQLVESGANEFFGPTFRLEDNEAETKAAREKAMDHAREQAEFYASKSGYGGVKLLSISESIYGRSSMDKAEMIVTAQRASAAPIEQGEVGTSVSINVQYEMVP